MKNRIIRLYKIILCIVAVQLFTTAFCFAVSTSAEFDDELDANNAVPFTLESASVEDRARNVPINPIIELIFNKNVANIAVLENNASCFHLIDSSGNPVTIDIIFPDEQIQKDYKRNVFIIPQKNLQPHTDYQLIVDNILTAKNGTVIDNVHIISFTTGNKAGNSTNATLSQLGDDIMVFTSSSGKTEYSQPKKDIKIPEVPKEAQNSPPVDPEKLSSLIFNAVIVLLVLITVILIIIKRQSLGKSG